MARLRIESAPEVTIFDEAFVVKAASGATAPLFQFKDSSGTVVGDITTAGVFNVVSVVASNAGTGATALATRGYVDTLSAGIRWQEAIGFATTAVLPASVYDNGTSGVGATLTGTSNGRLSIDSTNQTTGKSILVKDQSNSTENGIYTITAQGTVSTPFILTRRVDSDNSAFGKVKVGDAVLVLSGTINSNQGYILSSDGSGVDGVFSLGTDILTWNQFTGTAALTVGNGLTKTRKLYRYNNRKFWKNCN